MTQPLPHGLRVLADAAGVEAALEIALKRGGSRLSIPSKAEGSVLEELVGIDAARKIVNHLSGERIEIPSAVKLLNNWLRDEHGWSQERRATKLRRARRTIQGWDKAAAEADSPQQDLFDPAA